MHRRAVARPVHTHTRYGGWSSVCDRRLAAMTSALVATRDPVLLDELSRLVAAAGATLVVGTDGPLRAWSSSTLVLVGADLTVELVGLDPPHRPHVYVVASGPAHDNAFRVALALGAERVVELPTQAAWLSGVMADLGEERDRPGRLVGVIGGSGGAGATTFACALGQVAARDGPSVVVDTDPWGPGIDRVLGLDGTPGVHWDDLGLTSGRLGARSFREALPHDDGLGVLTWSAGSTAELSVPTVRESLSAAARGHDVVVVDLPAAAVRSSRRPCCAATSWSSSSVPPSRRSRRPRDSSAGCPSTVGSASSRAGPASIPTTSRR